jgi:hypothetical protein
MRAKRDDFGRDLGVPNDGGSDPSVLLSVLSGQWAWPEKR